MRDVSLANALGNTFTKTEAREWLGNGGMLFVWDTTNPYSMAHADVYIRTSGKVLVSLTNYLGMSDGQFDLGDVDNAIALAVAYVRGTQK